METRYFLAVFTVNHKAVQLNACRPHQAHNIYIYIFIVHDWNHKQADIWHSFLFYLILMFRLIIVLYFLSVFFSLRQFIVPCASSTSSPSCLVLFEFWILIFLSDLFAFMVCISCFSPQIFF